MSAQILSSLFPLRKIVQFLILISIVLLGLFALNSYSIKTGIMKMFEIGFFFLENFITSQKKFFLKNLFNDFQKWYP